MKPCHPTHPCGSDCTERPGCSGLIVLEGARRVISTEYPLTDAQRETITAKGVHCIPGYDEADCRAPDEAGRWIGFVIVAAVCVFAFLVHVAYRYATA